MRNILLILLSISFFSGFSQSEEVKNRIIKVMEKMESIPPYSCDVDIAIDVKFINIKKD